jgi:predicted membrane protein
MSNHRQFHFSWVGFLLIILGVLFLGDQLGFLDFGEIVSVWWPAILVLIALSRLASDRGLRLSGWILLVIGGCLLLRNLDILPFNVWRLWPVFLILLGLSMLVHHGAPRSSTVSGDTINQSVLFGGRDTAVRSPSFRGGSLHGLFGGATVDLRDATPVAGGADIQVSAVFGGVTFRVPPTWDVKLEGMPIFGGFSDDRRRVEPSPGTVAPVLRVRGTVLFGGVSVKD